MLPSLVLLSLVLLVSLRAKSLRLSLDSGASCSTLARPSAPMRRAIRPGVAPKARSSACVRDTLRRRFLGSLVTPTPFPFAGATMQP
jgi:hypothetical protein